MIHILGNLACEAEWRGANDVIPAHVRERIAALATVMRGLIDADEVTMWTDVPVEPARIPAIPGLPAVRLAVGTPPADVPVLAWGASARLAGRPAVPDLAITTALAPALRAALALPSPSVAIARAVNDRRLAARLGRELGCSAAHVVLTIEDAIDACAAAAAESTTRAWVAKAALTSAGRDRVRGGVPIEPPTRTRLARLIRAHGAVVIEPWLARRRDLAITGAIDAAGEVAVLEPHELFTDATGGFRGIAIDAPWVTPHDRDRLREVAVVVGRAIAAQGHRGPYTIDALVHVAQDGLDRLHPLVEVNARLSFGVVARALCARLGAARFGVGAEPPPGATILVSPAAAWVA
jgi:hypothetical protein